MCASLWWRWLALPGLSLALLGAGWLARPWVPPATLWMTEVAISTQMQDRTPGDSLDEVSAGQLRCEIAGVFPLEEAARAIELSRTGHVAGKLVIRVA